MDSNSMVILQFFNEGVCQFFSTWRRPFCFDFNFLNLVQHASVYAQYTHILLRYPHHKHISQRHILLNHHHQRSVHTAVPHSRYFENTINTERFHSNRRTCMFYTQLCNTRYTYLCHNLNV